MEHKWKYLSEKDSEYTTSLKRYLEVIFPNNDFVFDVCVPKDVFLSRVEDRSDISHRRFRPDARSEKLNLVVEFDGVQHYNKADIVFRDKDRDEWFKSLGYKVVRIPYWIQLSNEMIEYLFCKSVEEQMCKLEYSFYDYPTYAEIPGLFSGPGSMCEAGRYRFIDEFNNLPAFERNILYRDLLLCKEAEAAFDQSKSIIMPTYIEEQLIIPYDFSDFIESTTSVDKDKVVRIEN